jgi:hypothetical protein
VTGAIDLRASITKETALYQVSDLTLKIGGETVQGTAEVDVAGERPAAKIDIKAASVALPKIAAYLVDWEHSDVTSQIADVASGAAGLWPIEAFSLASLRAVDGTFAIKAPSMIVADGVALADAELEASLDAGTLSLSKLHGRAYGGTVDASGTLTALKGRAGVSGKLRLENIDLAALSRAQGGNEVAKGIAGLELSVEGEGLSPRGLLSVLKGEGRIVLGKGSFNGLSPAVLGTAANTYLNQEIPDKEELAGQLDGDFRKGRLAFQPVTLPVTVTDGVLRIAKAEFDGRQHDADAELTVDLASLHFDSEWRVAYQGTTDDGQALPPVRLIFAGPLSGFSSVKPQLYADQFERFLLIKRMDQDMDRLEKLNEQRGNPSSPSSTVSPRTLRDPRTEERPSAARTPSSEPVASGATIPTQSLLRGPPAALEPRGGGVGVNAPAAGWATDTEATGTSGVNTTGARPAPPKPEDFESQIREVLRAQEKERSPSSRR